MKANLLAYQTVANPGRGTGLMMRPKPESRFFTQFEARFDQFERFFRRLRSKSCFIMSGLSGFWVVYQISSKTAHTAHFEARF